MTHQRCLKSYGVPLMTRGRPLMFSFSPTEEICIGYIIHSRSLRKVYQKQYEKRSRKRRNKRSDAVAIDQYY